MTCEAEQEAGYLLVETLAAFAILAAAAMLVFSEAGQDLARRWKTQQIAEAYALAEERTTRAREIIVAGGEAGGSGTRGPFVWQVSVSVGGENGQFGVRTLIIRVQVREGTAQGPLIASLNTVMIAAETP